MPNYSLKWFATHMLSPVPESHDFQVPTDQEAFQEVARATGAKLGDDGKPDIEKFHRAGAEALFRDGQQFFPPASRTGQEEYL